MIKKFIRHHARGMQRLFQTDHFRKPQEGLVIVRGFNERTGKLAFEASDNLVTYGAREIMAHCLSGNFPENDPEAGDLTPNPYFIRSAVWGGPNSTLEPTSPPSATRGMTYDDLYPSGGGSDSLIITPVSAFDFVDSSGEAGLPDSVIISSTLASGLSDAVGFNKTLSQVALISAPIPANGDKPLVFAVFDFPDQLKFEQLRLSVNWQLIFQ